MNDANEHMTDRMRRALDRRAAAIDSAERASLRRMRAEAVARAAAPRPVRRWRYGLGGGLATAALALLVFTFLLDDQPPRLARTDEQAPPLELLASEEDLRMYESLAFAAWLAEQDVGVDDAG
jgi:hypothetical protein